MKSDTAAKREVESKDGRQVKAAESVHHQVPLLRKN